MKRNTAQLKEKLIQTGVEEIKKNGLDQLSLRTIAKNCGVTHGTPYRHFKSKEDYLRVVLTRLSTFLNQEIAQGLIKKFLLEISSLKWDLISLLLLNVILISLKPSLLNFPLSI